MIINIGFAYKYTPTNSVGSRWNVRPNKDEAGSPFEIKKLVGMQQRDSEGLQYDTGTDFQSKHGIENYYYQENSH